MSGLWEFIRSHWEVLGGLVVVATLWATGVFKFLFKRLWFRTFRNYPPTYASILTAFEERLTQLENQEGESNKTLKDKDKPVGERVRDLAIKVNVRYKRFAAKKQPDDLSEQAPTTYQALASTLHDIMGRLAELEADRPLVLPPSDATRRAFRKKELYVRTPEETADLRYLGVWGHYDPRDPRNSDWRVIDANRFIMKGQAKADARRERRWALFGIIVAFIVGIVAAGAAVLAIPTKESIFCQLGTPGRLPRGWVECDKGPDKPDTSSWPY